MVFIEPKFVSLIVSKTKNIGTKIILQLECGCVYHQPAKGKAKWKLCSEAEKLKQDYQSDFAKRGLYDSHFKH